MDRPIVQTGEIPRSQDVLFGWQQALVGMAQLSEALIGRATRIWGLATGPTSPASMSVEVQPGQIYELEDLEATAYGVLSADTTHKVLKQGLMLDAVQLACPAPSTAGYSINYLIQAAYVDQDGTPAVVPFYNASNPSTAYSGPNNSGATINTVRSGVCSVNVKAGVAAATGSQQTPTPDAGYVGVYVVTVANGATSIVAGDISPYNNAPFVGVPLTTTGTASNYDATNFSAAAYQSGRLYAMVPHVNNTGAATVDFGAGAIAIKLIDGGDPRAGDLETGSVARFRYDGTHMVLLNPAFAFKAGDSTQAFEAADAAVGTQQVTPIAQADSRYTLSGADGTGDNVVVLTANTTLTAADSGKLIAVQNPNIALQLPAPEQGLSFKVMSLTVGTTVAPPSGGQLLLPNNTAISNPLAIAEEGCVEFVAPDGAYQWRAAVMTGNPLVAFASASGQAVPYDQVLGLGQSWIDKTASRSVNTVYTNSESKPIVAAISHNNTADAPWFFINGLQIGQLADSSGTPGAFGSFIIPPGATYQLGQSSSDTFSAWVELR